MSDALIGSGSSSPSAETPSLSLRLARLLLGKSFASALDDMEIAQWLSEGEVEERANTRLAELLEHARTTVPYYRSCVRLKARSTTSSARADLAAFPVVTKRDLRAAGLDQLVSGSVPAHRRLERMTSGSTEEPFRFFLDRAALPVVFASHIFYDRWCGVAFGERYIRLVAPTTAREAPRGGPATARLRQILVRSLRGAYEHRTQRHTWHADVDLEAANRFREELESFRPAFVLGYTSTLAAVTAELLRVDQRSTWPLRGVITIAELLTPERRSLIERYFRAPITNRYGLREFGWWAGQSCTSSPDMVHLNTELVLCEILARDGSSVRAGEVGRLVMTDLHNRAMPLIRYDTGDLAVAETSSCRCGRGFPLITIEGRSYESLQLPSGRLVTPRDLGAALFECIGADSQYQLVQEAPNRVRLILVPGTAFGEATHAQLQHSVQAVVGNELQVSIGRVDRISPEPSGKRPTIKPRVVV